MAQRPVSRYHLEVCHLEILGFPETETSEELLQAQPEAGASCSKGCGGGGGGGGGVGHGMGMTGRQYGGWHDREIQDMKQHVDDDCEDKQCGQLFTSKG